MPSTPLKIVIYLIALCLLPFLPLISLFVCFCMIRWTKFQGRGEVLYTYLILPVSLPGCGIWGSMGLAINTQLSDPICTLLGVFIGILIAYSPCFLTKLVRFFFRSGEETGEIVLKTTEFAVLFVFWMFALSSSLQVFS